MTARTRASARAAGSRADAGLTYLLNLRAGTTNPVLLWAVDEVICRVVEPVLTLDFDVPDPKLLKSSNQNLHHYQRAEIVKYWRGRAKEEAETMGVTGIDKAHVTVLVRFPTRRRRDVGNLYSYLAKPLVDGMVDAGVTSDDDDAHLIGPDLRRDPERGPCSVRVEVREVGA